MKRLIKFIGWVVIIHAVFYLLTIIRMPLTMDIPSDSYFRIIVSAIYLTINLFAGYGLIKLKNVARYYITAVSILNLGKTILNIINVSNDSMLIFSNLMLMFLSLGAIYILNCSKGRLLFKPQEESKDTLNEA